MTGTIQITLVPVREADNHLGELWDAKHHDRLLARRSVTALRDACRVLIREGADPEAPIVVRYYGDDSGAEIRTSLRAAGELSPLGRVA